MKKCYTLILIIILVGIQSVTAQSWFNNDWFYRKAVTIDNSSNSNSLSDYQVNVLLDGGSNFDFGKALADGADLRVTDDDGTTLLSFWIETWDPPDASIWAKVPSIPANDTKVIYLYFGNSGASPASDGDSTFVFFDSFENFDPFGMNASTFLLTPTYDGSNEAVHPDVVYIPGGWNGYEYWMVMTPYPNSDDSFENPSILVSNNGTDWSVPAGLTNPLVPQPPGGINFDVDLLLVNDTLKLYYNEGISGVNTRLMTSTDGITWSSPQTVMTHPVNMLSPTVLYESGTYYVWYVRSSPNACNEDTSSVRMRSSSDGINWGSEQLVNLELPEHVVWHLDVQKEGSKYIMLFPAYKVGLSCDTKGMSLYYAESTDRINWTVNPTPVLRPTFDDWDDHVIYRSSFLVNETYFRIWYSAQFSSNNWHIGYTEGELDDFHNQSRWEETYGEVLATTEQPRSGNSGLKEIGGLVNGNDPPQIFKHFNTKYSFNTWFYDDLTTTTGFFASLGLWYLDQSIGVGVENNVSTTNYIYYLVGPSFNTTSIARTLGWHKFTINMKDTGTDLLIDDTVVGSSLATLIQRISLEGLNTGTGLFDDAYVREFSEPEPGINVSPVDEPLPVELLSFIAQAGNGEVLLYWETASEVNNLGFILLRSLEKAGLYQEITSYVYNDALSGAGNSNTTHSYLYRDKSVQNGLTYWYKLLDVDYSGAQYEHPAVSVTLSGDRDLVLADFALFQNYPNPFNSFTNIEFNIPEKNSNSRIRLRIYDIRGEKIKTLIDDRLEAGLHSTTWDGTNDMKQTVSSGVYLIYLRSDYSSLVKSMFLIK